MRELREAVVSEQEAKLWAYRTLEEHRVEQETYAAIKVTCMHACTCRHAHASMPAYMHMLVLGPPPFADVQPRAARTAGATRSARGRPQPS